MARLGRLGLTLAPLALVACATEPAPDRLVGQWGAPMLEIVAGRAAVELHLPCGARARFPRPLQPDIEGNFRLAGRAKQWYGGFNVVVVGQAHDAGLRVTLTETYDGGGQTISEEELVVGVTPDFPGVVCLASERIGP